MERSLEELLDGLEPEELDGLLPEELDTDAPEGAIERIETKVLEKIRPRAKARRSRPWLQAAAACLALVLALGAAGAAYAAEAREYQAAIRFFDENGLCIDGLSREDVKAVYRDITTQRFTCDKTLEVLERSVPGLEISQREPTPEELAELWDRNVWRAAAQPGAGICYQRTYHDGWDDAGDRYHFDKSVVDCYQDGELLWSAEFPGTYVEDCAAVAGGTAVWSYITTWLGSGPTCAWLARVDESGNVLWQKPLRHGFDQEHIAAVVDNGDGTWAVISRGDLVYLCLSQYDTDGNELFNYVTEVGNCGIWNVACLGDGYLVQLGNSSLGETARLVKLDREGSILDDFTYQGKDCDYFLQDMIEFGGRVYLSAYAVPRLSEEEPSYGSRDEIARILDVVFQREGWEISSEELTPLVRDNYTAVLLVCSPEGGEPETFYSVKGSLGAALRVNDAGELEWDVESVTSTFFSPATSSFTIGGNCQVFRYTFDTSGTLVSQTDTGEAVPYRR